MAASHGPSFSQELVVLLLGQTQSGKSSAGNTILQKPAFHKKTSRSCRRSGAVCGAQVAVVDTPGWPSRSPAPSRVSQELSRALSLCHPGPHAVLLVLPAASSFGPEDWGAMEAQLRLIQTPIWQRAMVLFTHGDKLGGLSIQDHIERQGRTLRWLLDRCGNRYQVLTNQSTDSEAPQQVSQLFEKMEKMMETNRRPREVRDRMYTRLRRELSLRGDRRPQGRQEDLEMGVMHDGRPEQRTMEDSGGTYLPRGFSGGGFRPALGLVLLGRRRSGKSSVGNLILDREEFQVDVKTSRCSLGHGEVWGWPVTVVDTPGWSLFGLADPKQVQTEISRSRSLCPAGSRVSFLLAVPVGSFRERDRRAVEVNLGVLGGGVWRRTVVVFTYGEELGGRTVQEHVEQRGEPLQWLLDRCGQRHQVIDTNTADRKQTQQLLETLQQL